MPGPELLKTQIKNGRGLSCLPFKKINSPVYLRDIKEFIVFSKTFETTYWENLQCV